jgi:Squalene/phytoene synthase
VQVREKLVVPMRMQWWRDAVNGIYKAKPIRHPVIQCLHQVLGLSDV